MKRFNSKWLYFTLFALAYLALRVFWITCDTGIPSTWEFGFHTTDEGYYLCGGKEMFLWGSFVDLTRQEALNYCYSYGTHWLSYLAHLCFGLSTWTWRIPFVVLYFIAWLSMFGYVAKRSGALFALATCLAASSLPLVITYERGFSNDATIAALVAIAFALAAGRGWWRIVAAAFVTSSIVTIKPAVFVMMPIVIAALLEDRKTRSRWLDVVLFAVLVVAMTYGWKFLSALTVIGEAERNGLSTWQVLARVNATYGLPTIMDIEQDFRALASFPRDPSFKTMGPSILMISVVPAAMLLTNVMRRKWNGHLLVYLMMPLYAYALNVINSMYTHYFLPLLILLPSLFSMIREDFADLADEKIEWKKFAFAMMLFLASLGVAIMFVISMDFKINEVAPFYSRIHNLPTVNPWRMTWPMLLVGTLVGVGVVAWCRGIKTFCRESWIWAIVFFLIVSIALAGLPAAVIAPRMHVPSQEFYWPIAMNMIVGCLFAFALFTRPAVLARPVFTAAMSVVPIVASYVLLPSWRSAAVELVTRHEHYDAYLAKELERILPKNAVVLGERSDQALFSLPIRACSTFLAASNPIPYVKRIWQDDSRTPIYALIDSQCNYNLQHFHEHQREYRLDLIKTFKMPSFSDGQLADVYLCKVIPVGHQERGKEK